MDKWKICDIISTEPHEYGEITFTQPTDDIYQTVEKHVLENINFKNINDDIKNCACDLTLLFSLELDKRDDNIIKGIAKSVCYMLLYNTFPKTQIVWS